MPPETPAQYADRVASNAAKSNAQMPVQNRSNITIDELVRLEILTRDGRLFRHWRAGTIVHAIRVSRGQAHLAATPGRPSL